MEAGLALLKEKSASRWIADASKMEGSFEDSNDWLAEEWTPRAQAAGLKRVVFVVSPDFFNELSTQEYAERNAELESPSFKTIEEAVSWIKGR